MAGVDECVCGGEMGGQQDLRARRGPKKEKTHHSRVRGEQSVMSIGWQGVACGFTELRYDLKKAMPLLFSHHAPARAHQHTNQRHPKSRRHTDVQTW